MFSWIADKLISWDFLRNKIVDRLKKYADKTDNIIDDAAVYAVERFLNSGEYTVPSLLQAVAMTASEYTQTTVNEFDDLAAEILLNWSKTDLSYKELINIAFAKVQTLIDESENVYDDAVYRALDTLREHYVKQLD